MSSFEQTLKSDIDLVNEALDKYLQVTDSDYGKVIEAMRYSVMNAGKRIRPVLTMEFCRLNGGNKKGALACACAVEMIHCSSLIHDDLPCMDDDDLRRGKPSCHKAFDEATALLAGDALILKACEVATKAIGILSSLAGTEGMIGGQVIDLASEGKKIDADTLSKMHSLKTSALIRSACCMGAVCADADEENVKNASEYGEYLGLAFQVIDDILDVVGDEKQLGKPIGSDEQNDKTTYVSLFGLEVAHKKAEQYTNKALSILDKYEGSEFLKELTKTLLKRNK